MSLDSDSNDCSQHLNRCETAPSIMCSWSICIHAWGWEIAQSQAANVTLGGLRMNHHKLHQHCKSQTEHEEDQHLKRPYQAGPDCHGHTQFLPFWWPSFITFFSSATGQQAIWHHEIELWHHLQTVQHLRDLYDSVAAMRCFQLDCVMWNAKLKFSNLRSSPVLLRFF